jgi:diguanylate cyclase (GGDEF)-like protein
MIGSFLNIHYDRWLVLYSFVIASLASYVALDLAKRVRTPDRAIALGWWLAGSVTMGTGIWAMHFVGMLAAEMPFTVGYAYGTTALSWIAAVAVSAIALHIAARERLDKFSAVIGASVMGSGICAMHYAGMAALQLQPGIDWNWWLVGGSAVIALVASTVALAIFFALRRISGALAHAWQAVAALVMGSAIVGMHFTGMAAARFPAGTLCLSAGQLSGDRLALLVSAAAIVLMTMTLSTSVLDARMQGKTAGLAQSAQAANAELQQLAFRDSLTGLPNRLLFEERLAQAFERSQPDGVTLVVLFVDLDGFKLINDSFGHAFGDEVLRQMAQRLAAQTRPTDTLARVGGDEFLVLLEGQPDAATAAQVAQRLIDAAAVPMVCKDCEVRLSCSIGIAMHPFDGPHEKLIARADSAMYAAKRAGKSAYAFFESHMDAGAREQMELQRDLRAALEHGGELELHYQPKVRADLGVITGAEALLRWRHPSRGFVSPAVFIPVAERFGLIAALGNWVIDQACQQIRSWRMQDLHMRIAINLSVHQLRQDNLVQRVLQALTRHGLEPEMLTFEITETAAMEDSDVTTQALEQLRTIGVQLSIDDFGTGYSSLSYLRRLNVGQIKIDRSFVQDLETSADARAIVQAVVSLSHALGLSVVAEGVETEGQRRVLQSLRCDELQGYLLAKPMPADGFGQWMACKEAASA